MSLEELKVSWQLVDKKMEASNKLNERLVQSVFSRRVETTIDSIHQKYGSFYVVLSIEIVFLLGVLFGNPFDFRMTVQYVPYVLLLIGVVIAFANLATLHLRMKRLSATERISEYLRKILNLYEGNQRFEKWFRLSLFTVALLVPFSFIPNKLAAGNTLSEALLDTAIATAFSLGLFVGAYKLGLFRNRHKERLQEDLKEWESLRDLSRTLA